MKVEIWSDVVCPWCYIGKRRFERALTSLGDDDRDIEVQWRSFQLNPDQPRGTRTTHDEYLAAKLGTTKEQVHELNARVVSLAAAEGLAYDFDRYQVINTFDSHRVAHLGATHGLGDAVTERFLSGQLEQGEVLDDPETLVRLGSEVGLPADEIRDVLATDRFADEVRADYQEARSLGIGGVPFFVIDRRYGISGAQPSELFVQALTQARAETSRRVSGVRYAPVAMGASDHYSDHMVRSVTATEAKARILALLDEVEAGEEIEITRHGRLVARLVPARGGAALKGRFRGLVTNPGRRRAPVLDRCRMDPTTRTTFRDHAARGHARPRLVGGRSPSACRAPRREPSKPPTSSPSRACRGGSSHGWPITAGSRRSPRSGPGLRTCSRTVRTAPVTPAVAVTAAELPAGFPSDPIDRLIYATALEHGWRLVTKDRRIRAHDRERSVVVW